MTDQLILVVGTGTVGMAIIQALVQNNKNVRVLVRKTTNPEKIEKLKKLNIELVYGDLKEPDTLVPACKGVKVIISAVNPAFQIVDGKPFVDAREISSQTNLLEVAEAAGVEQFYPSHYGARVSQLNGYHLDIMDAKEVVFEALKKLKSLSYTGIHTPAIYECWLTMPFLGFDPLNAKGTIYGDENQKVPFVSLKNITEVILATLGKKEFYNKEIHFFSGLYSWKEAIQTYEKVSGKKFDVTVVSKQDIQERLKKNPKDSIAVLALCLSTWHKTVKVDLDEVRKQFPTVKLETLEEYAKRLFGKE